MNFETHPQKDTKHIRSPSNTVHNVRKELSPSCYCQSSILRELDQQTERWCLSLYIPLKRRKYIWLDKPFLFFTKWKILYFVSEFSKPKCLDFKSFSKMKCANELNHFGLTELFCFDYNRLPILKKKYCCSLK